MTRLGVRRSRLVMLKSNFASTANPCGFCTITVAEPGLDRQESKPNFRLSGAYHSEPKLSMAGLPLAPTSIERRPVKDVTSFGGSIMNKGPRRRSVNSINRRDLVIGLSPQSHRRPGARSTLFGELFQSVGTYAPKACAPQLQANKMKKPNAQNLGPGSKMALQIGIEASSKKG